MKKQPEPRQEQPEVELRDVFAMQAMRVIPTPVSSPECGQNPAYAKWAEDCYAIADYLMLARTK